MTRHWKSTSKTYINCDICGKEILFTRKNRQRCGNNDGTWTECQREAQRRRQRGELHAKRRKVRHGTGGCDCLKCGGAFKPIGKYNRICDECTVENERYKEVVTSYQISINYLEDYVHD